MKLMTKAHIFFGILLALAVPAAAQMEQHATYRMALDKDQGIVAYLPDANFTPGATRTTDPKEVCSQTTKQFRKTTATMKRRAYSEYAAKKIKDRCCEVDHLVPLELGGADDVVNLWPQPYPQAHWKDAVEGWLHREVCAGRRELVSSQRAIATNWYALYVEMNSDTSKPAPSAFEEGPHAAMKGN